MTHLSPRQREIVVLVGRDGHQWRTVAKLLDISIHTVRSHVDEIRRRVESDKEPRLLMAELYYTHPDEYEEAA